ncbi:MAG: hypothetical protein ACN6RL_05980 [Variovorax sp.]|jgi:uncharacterized protein YecE (DUF72 family)
MPGETRIGISGWKYAPWRGKFYPRGLAQRRELEFAIKGSRYIMMSRECWQSWKSFGVETGQTSICRIRGPRV